MSKNLSVYCIVRVTDPPVSLTKRENGAFYCHIPVPIPDRLVVFCEGDWTDINQYNVTLTYKDDEIQLGHVDKANSCLMWRSDEKESMPKSMASDKEKGLAKLVVDIPEGQQIPDDQIDTKQDNKKNCEEKKISEAITNTPDKSGKNKRRNSLNKSDKTQNEPSAKKQKMDGTKQTTRTRTPKNDAKGTRSQKTSSPKSENMKSESKSCQVKNKNSPLVERQESVKKENSSPENGKKTSKATPKSKEPAQDSENSGETDVKKGRKGSKKDTDLKSPTVKQDTKEKEDKQTVDSKPKRAKREKPKLDTSNVESDANMKSSASQNDFGNNDKENIHVDTNVTVEEKNKQIGLNEAKIRELKEKLLNSGSKLKIATCKDLTTSRADRPDPRWGHTFCFVNKNLSVLIGGQGEKQQLCKDGVWSLNNETRRWRMLDVQTESQKPEYRMGHSATYDPLVRCIYVYGGSKNTRWFHDVHMLDLDEWKWQLVKVNGKAPTRAYHSATLYRHELWIFGGVYPRPDPQPDGCSNDIHIFSPVMESWYAPIVKGEKPIPRSGHSATLIDDQLVVFGGWDAPISYSDLHILDMSIVEWTQPNITGTPPSPRSWHASCALTGKRLLIHGGYNGDFALEDTHIFNLDQLNWTQILVENQPCSRVGHKAVCMPYRQDNNDEEDEVIIFGGGDNDGAYFNDIYSIYLPFEPATVNIDS